MRRLSLVLTSLVLALGVIAGFFLVRLDAQGGRGATQTPATPPATAATLLPQERRLSNLRQLTFGGENAEAYFSFDGQRLSFQSSKDRACDQIFTMRIDGSDVRMVSNGEGRTTCSHYTPDGKSVVYAS